MRKVAIPVAILALIGFGSVGQVLGCGKYFPQPSY